LVSILLAFQNRSSQDDIIALVLDLPSHDAGLLYLTWNDGSLDGTVFLSCVEKLFSLGCCTGVMAHLHGVVSTLNMGSLSPTVVRFHLKRYQSIAQTVR
jgi:hypothetical protein